MTLKKNRPFNPRIPRKQLVAKRAASKVSAETYGPTKAVELKGIYSRIDVTV